MKNLSLVKLDNLPLKEVKKIFKRKREGSVKIIGDVNYHRDFFSKSLNNKRDIIVWLPPSYKNDIKKNYPVLYMHDGQNIMNPKTAFAGVDWRADETATKLIRNNIIEEIIIVGINNTPDRLEEYSDSPKGKNYIKFLCEELKPFIDEKYRTLTEAANTAVMGSSMGGLISFLIVWNHPEKFQKAACLSSSFYYDNDKAIRMVKDLTAKKEIRIYLDHGEDGLREGQRMFSALTEKDYLIGKDIDYFYAPGANHNEAEWAKRLERSLKFLFGKK